MLPDLFLPYCPVPTVMSARLSLFEAFSTSSGFGAPSGVVLIFSLSRSPSGPRDPSGNGSTGQDRCACMRACVHACVCACVRVCVRACVHVP